MIPEADLGPLYIQNKALCDNSQWLSVVSYYRKVLHLRSGSSPRSSSGSILDVWQGSEYASELSIIRYVFYVLITSLYFFIRYSDHSKYRNIPNSLPGIVI